MLGAEAAMVVALVLAGCSSDYALQEAAGGAGSREPSTPVLPAFASVSVEADGGSAIEAEEDPTGTVRRERFVIGGGTTTPVADFLFVVDHSASMERVV